MSRLAGKYLGKGTGLRDEKLFSLVSATFSSPIGRLKAMKEALKQISDLVDRIERTNWFMSYMV